MIIFYARCSTAEQNEARQLGDAHACHAEKIYIDKASGKNRDRPQLEAMISFAGKVIKSSVRIYPELHATRAIYLPL